MNKKTLLNILDNQLSNTKKTTRKDIISLVRGMVDYHIRDNSEIEGLSATRSFSGVNLGEVMEIVAKSLFNNKLSKSAKDYDAMIKGDRVEIKFTTSDAYAHAINNNAVVDYYLIIAYSKSLGGMVFKVPYTQRNKIVVNNQGRVVVNQNAKFLDRQLTDRVFAF